MRRLRFLAGGLLLTFTANSSVSAQSPIDFGGYALTFPTTATLPALRLVPPTISPTGGSAPARRLQ